MFAQLNHGTRALSPLLAGALAGACTIITVEPTESGTSATSSSSDGSGSTAGTDSGATSEGSNSATQGSNSGTQGTSEGTSVGTQGTSVGTTETSGSTTGAETTGDVGCDGGCGAGEYCDWNANSCGSLRGDVGTCKPLPDGCDDDYAPVCGCDGEVHSNGCYASSAGTDVAAAGGCLPPADYFDCGYRFCDQGTSYCQVSYNDVLGEPDFYECKKLPEACMKEQVCGCLEGEPCFEFECSDVGGLTLYCPGG